MATIGEAGCREDESSGLGVEAETDRGISASEDMGVEIGSPKLVEVAQSITGAVGSSFCTRGALLATIGEAGCREVESFGFGDNFEIILSKLRMTGET